MLEHVVLVDEQNNILGTMPKNKVHGAKTPLHRAFSCFIFKNSRLLLQQRSALKKTWPLVWSNSCCGHPMINESSLEAAYRRLKHELGLKPDILEEIAPYRYNFVKDGVMENEICPILAGVAKNNPIINPKEVNSIKWIIWKDFLEEIKKYPENYSPWCVEEAFILSKSEKIEQFLHE